jgi:hypothetical protein
LRQLLGLPPLLLLGMAARFMGTTVEPDWELDWRWAR